MNIQQKVIGGKFMEQTSLHSDIPPIKVLEAEIRESFGKVVYTQKIQDECAIQIRHLQKSIKRWQIILSAISTGGFLSVGLDILKTFRLPDAYVTWGNSAFLLLSGLVSLGLLCVNAYTKENDLCALANDHKNTGNKLWCIRERYIFLLTAIKMGETPIQKLIEERTKLFEETAAIYATAPCTNSKAYVAARKALKKDEELTFSQSEIDNFLPKQLQFDSPIYQKKTPRHIIAE